MSEPYVSWRNLLKFLSVLGIILQYYLVAASPNDLLAIVGANMDLRQWEEANFSMKELLEALERDEKTFLAKYNDDILENKEFEDSEVFKNWMSAHVPIRDMAKVYSEQIDQALAQKEERKKGARNNAPSILPVTADRSTSFIDPAVDKLFDSVESVIERELWDLAPFVMKELRDVIEHEKNRFYAGLGKEIWPGEEAQHMDIELRAVDEKAQILSDKLDLALVAASKSKMQDEGNSDEKRKSLEEAKHYAEGDKSQDANTDHSKDPEERPVIKPVFTTPKKQVRFAPEIPEGSSPPKATLSANSSTSVLVEKLNMIIDQLKEGDDYEYLLDIYLALRNTVTLFDKVNYDPLRIGEEHVKKIEILVETLEGLQDLLRDHFDENIGKALFDIVTEQAEIWLQNIGKVMEQTGYTFLA